jgi:hypothetical protein
MDMAFAYHWPYPASGGSPVGNRTLWRIEYLTHYGDIVEAQHVCKGEILRREMDTSFVPPVVFHMGELVKTPIGTGTVQFWIKIKGRLRLAVSQDKKQTELADGELWKLSFVDYTKVRRQNGTQPETNQD